MYHAPHKPAALKTLQEFQRECREALEPDLLAGDKNLWNIISGMGGALPKRLQDRRDDGVQSSQLEFWNAPFSAMANAAPAWKKLDEDRRNAVLEEWRKTAKKLPADLARRHEGNFGGAGMNFTTTEYNAARQCCRQKTDAAKVTRRTGQRRL